MSPIPVLVSRAMGANDPAWAEYAEAILRDAGYRSGGARRQVLDLFAEQGCALSPLAIDERLGGVGRASVYRALDQLAELGLVQRVDLGTEGAGYERLEPGGHHHHHLVCESCGCLVAFESERLERAIAAVSELSEFEVRGHDVTLRGDCARCAKEAGRSA
jgi:Fur family transcriptional regulator, ferric uptake regulator